MDNNKFWGGGVSSPKSSNEELGNSQYNNSDGTLVVPSPTTNNNPQMANEINGGGGYPPPLPTQQRTTTTANKSEENSPASSRKHVTFQKPLTNPYFNYKPKKRPTKELVEKVELSNQQMLTSAIEHNINTFGNATVGKNTPNGANAQMERNIWPFEGPKYLGDTMYPPETSKKSQTKKGGFGHRLSTDFSALGGAFDGRWNQTNSTHQFCTEGSQFNRTKIDQEYSEYESREVEGLSYFGSHHRLLRLQIQTGVYSSFAVCQAVKTPFVYVYWMLFDGEKFTGLCMGHLSDDIVCPPEVAKWHKIKYSINAEDPGLIFVRKMEEIAPIIPLRLHGEHNIQFLLRASKQPDSVNYRTILGEIELPKNIDQNQLYVWVSLVWPKTEEGRAFPFEDFSPIALKIEELSSPLEVEKLGIYEPTQLEIFRQKVADQLGNFLEDEQKEEGVEEEDGEKEESSSFSYSNPNKSSPKLNIQRTNNMHRREQFGFGLLDDFQPHESVQPMDENEAKKMKRVVCKMPKYLHPHGIEIQRILDGSGVLVKVHPEEDPREVFEMEGPAGAIRDLIEHYKWACESLFQFIEEIDLSEQHKQDTNSSFPSSSRGGSEELRAIHNSSSSSNGTENEDLTAPHGSRSVSFKTSEIPNSSEGTKIEGTKTSIPPSPIMASEIARLLVDSPIFLQQIKEAIFGNAQLPQDQPNNNNPESHMIPPLNPKQIGTKPPLSTSIGPYHPYNRSKKGPVEKCESAKREAFACLFQITKEHAVFALYSIDDYKFKGEHKKAAIPTLPHDIFFGLGHWYKIEYSRYATNNASAASYIHIWKMELLTGGVLEHSNILERLPRVEVVEGVVQFCVQVSFGLHSQFGVVSGGVSQAEILASQGLPPNPNVNFMAWFRVTNIWSGCKYSLVRVEAGDQPLDPSVQMPNPTPLIPHSSAKNKPSIPPEKVEVEKKQPSPLIPPEATINQQQNPEKENSIPTNFASNTNHQQPNQPPKIDSSTTVEQTNETIFPTSFGSGFSHNSPNPFVTNEETGSVHQPQSEQQFAQEYDTIGPASEQAAGVCWRLNDEKASFMIYDFQKRRISKSISAPLLRDMVVRPELGKWHSLEVSDERGTIRIVEIIREVIPTRFNDQHQVLFRVEGKFKRGQKGSVYATPFGKLYPPISARADEMRPNSAVIWCRFSESSGKFVFTEFA